MITSRLRGIELLEQRQLLTTLVDSPLAGLSPDHSGDYQCSFAGTVLNDCLIGDRPAGPSAGYTGTILNDV